MEDRRKKLLVVDDEPEIVSTLKDFLSVKGYEVACAASGEEALGILENQRADLVIIDFRMPGINGTDVAKIVKDKYPGTKIIILTGYMDEAKKLSVEGTLEDIFIKPIKLKEFNNRLAQLFRVDESAPADFQAAQEIMARVLRIHANLLFLEPSLEVFNMLKGYFGGLGAKGEDYALELVQNEEKVAEKLVSSNPDLLIINAIFLKHCSADMLTKILDKNFNLKEVLIYNIRNDGLVPYQELYRLGNAAKAFCMKNGLLEVKWVEI